MKRDSRRLVLFFKAQRFKDQPGYAFRVHRWHSMLPEGESGGWGGYRLSAAEILAKQPRLTVLSESQWAGTLKELSALARRVYTETLQGQEILNLDQHYRVRFTAEGRGEAFVGIKASIDAQVVKVLSRLVRRGDPERKNWPDRTWTRYHYSRQWPDIPLSRASNHCSAVIDRFQGR